mmetsp:Transcript_3529/g.6526  ORF Transcript_3529/g.6526 Transcript_3529/m.6526 type:complete len:237 (+) Transcript_3529:838-1548(+)
MGQRRPVARRHSFETVPLHPTLKPLPLAHAGHVQKLPGNEVPGVDAVVRPEHRRLPVGVRLPLPSVDAELPHDVRRRMVRVARPPPDVVPQGPLHVLRLRRARPDLHGVVPVAVLRLDLDDPVVVEEEDGAGVSLAPDVPHGNHSEFQREGARPAVGACGPAFGGRVAVGFAEGNGDVLHGAVGQKDGRSICSFYAEPSGAKNGCCGSKEHIGQSQWSAIVIILYRQQIGWRAIQK